MKIQNLRQTGGIAIVASAVVLVLVVSLTAKAALVDINNRVIVTYTNNTTTFTNISGLSFALMPNTRYQFEVSAIYLASYAEFAVAQLPIGTTFTICGVENAAYGTSSNGGCTSATGHYITTSTGSASDELAYFSGSIVTGPTGGTFQMQGATAVSGYALTVEVNSWIQAQVSSA